MLRAALEKLPANYREVLVLRELEGMSYEKIAVVMGVPIGTVMSGLARGRDSCGNTCCEGVTRRRNVACESNGRFLHGYLDGELDLVRTVEFEEHLKGCADCAAIFASSKSCGGRCVQPILTNERLRGFHL